MNPLKTWLLAAFLQGSTHGAYLHPLRWSDESIKRDWLVNQFNKWTSSPEYQLLQDEFDRQFTVKDWVSIRPT